MQKVDVGKKILSANEEYALKNSRFLAERKKVCLNMISSPGSGKTTILSRTISELKDKIKIGVIEGDIQTDLDAERIKATGAPAIFTIPRDPGHVFCDSPNATCNPGLRGVSIVCNKISGC